MGRAPDSVDRRTEPAGISFADAVGSQERVNVRTMIGRGALRKQRRRQARTVQGERGGTVFGAESWHGDLIPLKSLAGRHDADATRHDPNLA